MQYFSDATHTYRGFRRQALFILHEILLSKESNTKTFQPEGKEDLAILKQEGDLDTIIQVKDYSSSLSLSNLDPKNPNSFLYRANAEIKNNKNTNIQLVSFGPIGQELENC